LERLEDRRLLAADDDGGLDIGFGAGGNSDPIITSPAIASVPENTTAVMNVVASDADAPPQIVTFSIAGGEDQSKFGITSDGALSFLAPPDFDLPGDANGDNVYAVMVQASDGEGGMDTQMIDVSVTPVNDNTPIFTSPNTASIPENNAAVMIVTATDADAPSQTVTFSIVGGVDQTRFSITAGGVLSFVAPPDFEMPTDDNIDNVYEITVQADDGNGGTAAQTIEVTVTPMNDDAPEFTSPTGFVVPENTTAVTTVTATDSDLPPQTVTFSLAESGDFALFTITPGGVLTFNSPPDFEAPADLDADNSYELMVLASDGEMSALQAIAIIVSNVNDNPFVFTSPAHVVVNQGTLDVMTVAAADADKPGIPITYTLVGGADQALFSITSGGLLSFLTPPSVAMPMDANGDNVYELMVKAVDDDGQMITQAISVSVIGAPTDFGDAPDTVPGAGPGNYQTTAADNGPRHSIVAGLRMGTIADGDNGALQNAAANADDVNGALPDDEDGLVNPAIDLWVTAGAQPTVNIRVTNQSGTAATLWGWIDYNANGVFENATERASVAVPTGTNNGLVTLTFPPVVGSFTGDTFARFRLSTDADAADPTGEVADGEVEDYRATITGPSNGTADPTRNRKIASATNGGPSLNDGDMFGSSLARIGDLDGDGVLDLLVGAPVQFGALSGGKAYVLLMNVNGTVKSSQEIGSGVGGGPALALGDYFGHSVASIGDLDGDGIGDIAVGADKDDTGGYNRGAVYVLFMNTNGTVKSSTKIAHNTGSGPALVNGDRFGSSISALGDLDGDGVTDLAIGAAGDGPYRGAVHVLFMNASGSVKASQKIPSGTGGDPTLADFDNFGSGAASLGDLDGDGVTELAVGAFRDNTGGAGRGAVHVLFLNSDGTVKASTKIASGVGGGPLLADESFFGRSVASVGDLDGDGLGDLAVGAYRGGAGGNRGGELHVLFLNANGTVKLSKKIASGVGGGPVLANGDRFGSAVTAIGDLDGDGVIELAVGAETDATGGIARGALHVLSLNGANTNPVFTSPTAVNVPEISTAVLTITASDADFPPQTVTFTIIGGADQAKFTLTPGGALSFAAPPDFEAAADADSDNVYVVSVLADDGNGGTANQTIHVMVTPVNDAAPVITSPKMVNVAENSTAVLTVTATDADLPPQSVTFSIVGGADQSKFSITPGGELTFMSPPDFEVPTDANGDNVYVVNVQASDGGLTSVQAILVTATPVNDNSPVITSPAMASVVENSTAVMTVTATDADLPAAPLSFSIVAGADHARFVITGGGALSFLMAPDFDAPVDADGNNVYEVVVRASDGNGGTTVQTIHVSVSPLNDNRPVFTSPDMVSTLENSTAVLTVTAADADRPPQMITLAIVGGADQLRFNLANDGELSFNAPPNFEAPSDSNGDNVYVVIVQASDGTLAELQAILVTVTDVVIEPLVGDYDGNGVVDAADYVLWRNGGPLQNEGATFGIVTSEDYDVWRANFGKTTASGGTIAFARETAIATNGVGDSSMANASVPATTTMPANLMDPLLSLPIGNIEAVTPPRFARRPSSRVALEPFASRDDALAAWLASRATDLERASQTAFNGVPGEPDDDNQEDRIVDALDLAFAVL
jgi:hypothetical protein